MLCAPRKLTEGWAAPAHSCSTSSRDEVCSGENAASGLLSFGGMSQIAAGLLLRIPLAVSIQLFQAPRGLWYFLLSSYIEQQ